MQDEMAVQDEHEYWTVEAIEKRREEWRKKNLLERGTPAWWRREMNRVLDDATTTYGENVRLELEKQDASKWHC